MSNMDKPQKHVQPECLDNYGLKPCTAEYLERMRQVVWRDNLDIKCLFEKHDPLEWGNVSEHIFKCVMHEKFLCQCGFTLEIVQLITDFFRLPDGTICYKRLHALMTSTENIAQQLRECASKVPEPIISTAPLRYCGERAFGTEPCIPSILERLRTAYWRLRIKLTDLFRCCDPKCTGLVDEEKFQCILKQSLVPESGITERQLDAITNYYRACGNMIDYRRMAAMFDSTLSIQEQIQMNYITKREDLQKPRAVNTLCESEEERVKEIWCKVVYRADRYILTTLSSIFEKFAHRQSGETTVPHLRRFFNYLQVAIAESDFALLCKKYATNDYNINFLALIEDLDDIFHSKICPQPPAKRIPGADGPTDMEVTDFPAGGAGTNASVWGFGQCPCATEEEHKKGACLVPNASRFYEGGPVCGGDGKPPVWGKTYICKRDGAVPGQRFGGCTGMSPPAGLPTAVPAGITCGEKIDFCTSERADLRALMERLQQFLFRYRIRAKDFFKDYDPLNGGFISANRFRRGLNDMGVGVLGRLSLKEGEFDALVNFYRLTNDPSMVCWRKFESDIESIFIQKGIEKLPSVLTPSAKCIAELPNKGVLNPDELPQRVNQLAKCAVARLRHRVFIESCNIKYFFQGFDKVNNGHVSRQQFKQVLSMLNYDFTGEELDAMSVKYCDELGFDYLRLLAEIEPRKEDSGWYEKFKNGRLHQLNRSPPTPHWAENDIQRIMYKIQSHVVRRRPKLKAFLFDHDVFVHDRIKIVDFHRALDRAGLRLTPREVEVLTCCFRSPDDPCEIEWRCFNDAVETCFTLSNLEKAPRVVPHEWKPMREMDYDKELTKLEYCHLTDGMRRLSRKVYDRRILIKPMFFDFDQPQNGLVSQDQFHRVLHTVGLAEILTQRELEAICKKFLVIRGNKRDIDYIEFLAQLDAIVSVDPITLEERSPTGVEWYKQAHNCCPSPS